MGFVVLGGGGGSVTVPDASETVKGIAEIATQTETIAGTDDARIVTPLKLKSITDNFAFLANLGNILFVSASAPVASNLQTRSQAIGRIDKPFRNLQKAFDVCEDGDTIIIFAGTYTGNLTVIDKDNITIKCIGSVTINGNFTYEVGVNPNKQIKFLGNYSTTVNGSFLIANSNETFVFSVYGTTVNSGINYAFQLDANKRSTFKVYDCDIVGNFLSTSMAGNDNGVRPIGLFKNCNFTGVTPFPDQFSNIIVDDCVFNISSFFGVVRFDFSVTAQIKNSVINITSLIDYLFLGSFNAGIYGFKLENVKIVGTANRFVATFANRFFNLDIRNCDFREFTATNGYINVTDSASFSVWKVYIVNTFTSIGQLVYQTGSFTPPIASNEFIDIIQF